MIKAEVHQQFESILSGIRQPARLIGEESGSGPGFGDSPDEFRVVLGYPEVYEIGISNQAIQILYHLARRIPGVAVERTYLPWVDAIAQLREKRIPLLTVETWAPVVGADLLGLTLQHEFDYTNVLELLDLAGIPVRAFERSEEHPLVLAGGPACANFLPVTGFFDAVAVGDGEELFPEIVQTLAEGKREGISRAEARRRLTRVQGVYVPGLSHTVKRRTIRRLAGAPYPEGCLVPLAAGVHDRAWVEIMRGCTRGCRFCQAGMWYRPVRERSPGEIRRMAEEQLTSTGHQELAYASLSTTDYSCLEEILATTASEHPEVRVSLPSLRVDSAAVRLAHLVSPTGPSLTLAPEAGSSRMWRVVNKNVTKEDVLAAAEEAFRAGRTALKLYFMIGLPFEDDGDVVAIAELCLKIRDLGRMMLGQRANRLQLNVSINNFIPKPLTPFQWAGMADRETLMRRQDLLRSRLRRPGIKLTLHSADKSHLEAALARGGEELGVLIEDAWRRGARYDSWTEEFRADAWRAAFEAAGTSAEKLATAALPGDVPLPWDVIGGTVRRGYLWAEWEKAERGESTPDCRWDVCGDCGACEGAQRNDLAGESPVVSLEGESAGVAKDLGVPSGGRATGVRSATADGSAIDVTMSRRSFVATFSVTGRGRFIGHLDRVEIFRRAIRKAGGRLTLSNGMRPKPLLSLAMPLAVGVEGLRELCEFHLAEEPHPSFASRLAAALPAHMRLLALEPYHVARSLPARVTGALYEVMVSADPECIGEAGLAAALEEAVRRFGEAPELVTEDTREGRVRVVDVRSYVDRIEMEPGPGAVCTLVFSARVTPAGTARPERVVGALSGLARIALKLEGARRVEVLLS